MAPRVLPGRTLEDRLSWSALAGSWRVLWVLVLVFPVTAFTSAVKGPRSQFPASQPRRPLYFCAFPEDHMAGCSRRKRLLMALTGGITPEMFGGIEVHNEQVWRHSSLACRPWTQSPCPWPGGRQPGQGVNGRRSQTKRRNCDWCEPGHLAFWIVVRTPQPASGSAVRTSIQRERIGVQRCPGWRREVGVKSEPSSFP